MCLPPSLIDVFAANVGAPTAQPQPAGALLSRSPEISDKLKSPKSPHARQATARTHPDESTAHRRPETPAFQNLNPAVSPCLCLKLRQVWGEKRLGSSRRQPQSRLSAGSRSGHSTTTGARAAFSAETRKRESPRAAESAVENGCCGADRTRSARRPSVVVACAYWGSIRLWRDRLHPVSTERAMA